MGEEVFVKLNAEPQKDNYFYIGCWLSILLVMLAIFCLDWVDHHHNELEFIVSSLVLFWLVIGYLQNNRSIQLQLEELNANVREQKEQSNWLKEQAQITDLHYKQVLRDVTLRTHDLLINQLVPTTLNVCQQLGLNSEKNYSGYVRGRDSYVVGHANISRLYSDAAHEIAICVLSAQKSHLSSDMKLALNINEFVRLYGAFTEKMDEENKDEYVRILLSNAPVAELYKSIIYLAQTWGMDINFPTCSPASSKTSPSANPPECA